MMIYLHHLRVHSSLRDNEWSAVYANVVEDSSDALISNCIEILFAWLNLDSGVEACLGPFYLGMLYKVLQFAFAWLLTAGVIDTQLYSL